MELSLLISELGRLTVRYGGSATVITGQTDQLAVVRTWPQLGRVQGLTYCLSKSLVESKAST